MDIWKVKNNVRDLWGILFWEKMNGKEDTNAVVYGGDISLSTPSGRLIAWKDWV